MSEVEIASRVEIDGQVTLRIGFPCGPHEMTAPAATMRAFARLIEEACALAERTTPQQRAQMRGAAGRA
ncbi:MAG TPA: hypothetical protein VGR91_19795 [Stellaceae bacterium]|nr:hypothetical protein [Stellaceae bacterium]